LVNIKINNLVYFIYKYSVRTSQRTLCFDLTPWNGVLLEKLTGFRPVKKFPAFYGTRRFITAFTTARHMSL